MESARKVRRSGRFAAVALFGLAGPAPAAPCFDLAKGEPHALDGKLERGLFAGSMADVATGRVSEPGYLVRLDAPICITGDEFSDPATPFIEAEVRGATATEAAMRKLVGQRVHLVLSHPYGAETVHDHRPLVAFVESVTPAARPR